MTTVPQAGVLVTDTGLVQDAIYLKVRRAAPCCSRPRQRLSSCLHDHSRRTPLWLADRLLRLARAYHRTLSPDLH